MNRYETVFILTPVLSDDQAAETVDKFKKFLKAKGASIKHEENWGLRKLAYPIQKKSTGFYYLTEFEAAGDVIGVLETEFRRDERVIRFLTTVMDKFDNSEIRYLNPIDIETKQAKYCRFKKSGIKYIDYKDGDFLLKLCNEQGKILPRRLTGTSLKYQRKVSQAIKKARHLALMPYVADMLK